MEATACIISRTRSQKRHLPAGGLLAAAARDQAARRASVLPPIAAPLSDPLDAAAPLSKLPDLDAAAPVAKLPDLDAAAPLPQLPDLDAAAPLSKLPDLDAAAPLIRLPNSDDDDILGTAASSPLTDDSSHFTSSDDQVCRLHGSCFNVRRCTCRLTQSCMIDPNCACIDHNMNDEAEAGHLPGVLFLLHTCTCSCCIIFSSLSLLRPCIEPISCVWNFPLSISTILRIHMTLISTSTFIWSGHAGGYCSPKWLK